MFVRKTTRRYKDKTYTNYLLVESVHTPKGPRQKVICSLGDLSPRPAHEWLALARKVEDALVGQINLFSNPDPEVERIVHQVRERQARSAAHPADISDTTSRATRMSSTKQAAFQTLHRVPGSSHSGTSWWHLPRRGAFDLRK